MQLWSRSGKYTLGLDSHTYSCPPGASRLVLRRGEPDESLFPIPGLGKSACRQRGALPEAQRTCFPCFSAPAAFQPWCCKNNRKEGKRVHRLVRDFEINNQYSLIHKKPEPTCWLLVSQTHSPTECPFKTGVIFFFANGFIH